MWWGIMSKHKYLSILNEEQRQAAVHEGGSLLILAGAGSGKTRVITTKIAYLISEKNIKPSNILAVTFTKKAANEMAERARHLEPLSQYTQIRTFHSFGSWFLRLYGEHANLGTNFTVYDDDDMTTLLTKATSLNRQQATIVAHKISRAKDYCLTPDSPALVNISSDIEFPHLYALYQERLRETGNVDFGDLIMLPTLILQQNEKIREQMHYRFKVIMVDEYQDSNVAQFQLLQQLAGDGTYVCVVGDDDQSIYKFRGAEVQNILTFQEHFANTTIIKLEKNYRSIAPILKVADDVVQKNIGRLGKTLRAERTGGKKPILAFMETQDVETSFCAHLIQQSYERGCPYSDWAILYRTNAQSLGFETEFARKKIPYTVVGALRFYEREEIKDIVSFLSLIANPKDEIAFRRIINKPPRGIGAVSQDKIVDSARNVVKSEEDMLLGSSLNLLDACKNTVKSMSKKTQSGLQSFLDLIDELAEMIHLNTADELLKQFVASDVIDAEQSDVFETNERLSVFIEKIAQKSGLIDYHSAQDEVAGTQKVSNIQELANSAVLYPLTHKGLLDFLDHIELDRTLESDDEDSEKEKDAVTLITLHNTKGLEFPRVVMTGLEQGIFPRNGKDEDEVEEERRLFYVGATRAKDELYITSSALRRMYGKTEHMRPSPFLHEIATASVDIMGQTPPEFSIGSSKTTGSTKSELANRWSKGARVYHDDWGYGYISSTKGEDLGDDDYVITVQFETGNFKQFMPKFQAHSLMIVRD